MASATLLSIEDLLEMSFVVKSYQRGYRWDKTEIEELLSDLDGFQTDGGTSVYCLQPIVVKKDGDVYELVDGQQRLMALWLIKKYHQILFQVLGDTYSLSYEGKDSFNKLLSAINDLCNDKNKTKNDLLDMVNAHQDDSIDAYMLAESVRVMSEFHVGDTKLIHSVLSEIIGKLKYVGVIWYELDDTEDSISFFTNLNASKVQLTDAELIKASLYHLCLDLDQKKAMVSEWQEIEKKLYDEELWHFVTYDADKAVRIEYLFEIWCCSKGLPIENGEKNPIFHAVNSYLALGGGEALDLWNDIKAIFEALEDWKSGYETYHVIGFLTLTEDSTIKERRETNIKLIKELYVYYKNHKKSDFLKEIKRRVRDRFIDRKLLADNTEYASIEDGIGELRYDEKDSKKLIRRVLLFYNIALLMEAGNLYERFPFKALKLYDYEIEHVNPQTPQFEFDEKVKWLTDHKNYSGLSDSLKAEIESCLESGLNNFDYIANTIRTELELEEHFIGNLVLLDKSLNSSYQNECFVEKRKRIIERLRNTAYSEKIKMKWFEYYSSYSNLSSTLKNEIKQCLNADMRDFDRVANLIKAELNMDDSFINNLAILDDDRNVNEQLIDSLKLDDQKPILPGTKWVFLKEYDGVETNSIWSKQDVDTYCIELTKKIYNYLK